jgi:hypothetical protein
MIGLKAFLNVISEFSDEPFDALYERQRELVRCGLLPVRPGRGPGSGVPLTPETLATFLIGLLATDSLSEIARRTAQLSKAKPLLVTPLQKGAKDRRMNFHKAVASALADSNIASFQPGADLTKNECCGIQVTRHWRGMILQFKTFEDHNHEPAEGVQGIDYIVSEEMRLASSMISRTVSIEQEAFWYLCIRLRYALGADTEPVAPPIRRASAGIGPPSNEVVINLFDALKASIQRDKAAKAAKPGKPRRPSKFSKMKAK